MQEESISFDFYTHASLSEAELESREIKDGDHLTLWFPIGYKSTITLFGIARDNATKFEACGFILEPITNGSILDGRDWITKYRVIPVWDRRAPKFDFSLEGEHHAAKFMLLPSDRITRTHTETDYMSIVAMKYNAANTYIAQKCIK